MPGDRAPKVAYAVLIGRSPGVYSTWYDSINYFDSPHSNPTLGLKPRNKSLVSRIPAMKAILLKTEAEVEQKKRFRISLKTRR